MLTKNSENVNPVAFFCIWGTCSCVALGILTSCSGFMVPGLLTIFSGSAGYLITAYQVNEQNAIDKKSQQKFDEFEAEVKLAVPEKEWSEDRGDLD